MSTSIEARASVEASGFIWSISGQTTAAAPTAPTAPVARKQKVPAVRIRRWPRRQMNPRPFARRPGRPDRYRLACTLTRLRRLAPPASRRRIHAPAGVAQGANRSGYFASFPRLSIAARANRPRSARRVVAVAASGRARSRPAFAGRRRFARPSASAWAVLSGMTEPAIAAKDVRHVRRPDRCSRCTSPTSRPTPGAMLRTCACLGVDAAIIEPAGFVFSDRRFRRSGMDYLDHVAIDRHASFERFETWRRRPGGGSCC